MTIIDVKTSKSTAEPPSGRQRFEQDTGAPTSATPFYAGVMLSALMLYFRSIYDAWAEPGPLDLPPQQDEPEAAPDGHDISASASQDTREDQPSTDDENIVNSRFMAVKAALFRSKPSMQEEARINMGEAGVQQMQQSDGLEARSMMSQGTAVSFSVMPSNDNRLDSDSGSTEEQATSSGGTGVAPQVAPVGGDDDPPDAEPVARNPYASSGETPVPVSASNGVRNNVGHQGTYANRRPVAQQQVTLHDQFASSAVVIALADLLSDITDADGDTLSIVNASASSGELTLVDGGYSFVTDKTGKITITFDVTDGKEIIQQTATFNVVEGITAAGKLAGVLSPEAIVDGEGAIAMAAPALGALPEGFASYIIIAGDGVVSGTDGDDIIFGGLGADTITGGLGDDQLYGEAGDDNLSGGEGDDYIAGGEGDDVLAGGEGNDILDGGTGIDVVSGGAGHDYVIGTVDGSSDIYDGGTGLDVLDYSGAAVDLTFDLTAGQVHVGSSTETDLFSSFETFNGGSGNDRFEAAIGQDSTIPLVTLTTGDQTFDGGLGTDALSYSEALQSVEVDLSAGQASGREIGTDSFTSIETFETGSGNDTFIAAVSQPEAEAPAPIVETATTADQTFDGGAGIDTVDYSNAVQDIVVDVASSTAAGDEIGNDSLINIEVFETGAGNDVFVAAVAQAETSPVVETTTTADQSFSAGAGIDAIDYGNATQALIIDAEAGQASGAEIGTDTFSGIETLIAGSGDDTFRAAIESLAPVADASAPDETYIGGAGTDTIDYAATDFGILVDVAAETVTGDEIGIDSVGSVETFIGGSGNDRFEAAGLGLVTLVAAASNATLPEEIIPLEAVETASPDAGVPVEDVAVETEPTVPVNLEALALAVVEADAAVDTAVQNLTQVLVDAVAEGSTSFEIADAVSIAALEIEELQVAAVVADNEFIGGAGIDTLSYAGATESITIDLTTNTATGAEIGTDTFAGIEEFVGGAGDDTIIVGAGAVTLDGNAGNDMFVFLTDTDLSQKEHGDLKIKNFEVGDLVRMSKYDIFENALEDLEDAFHEVYGSEGAVHDQMEDVVIPIRIRHETIEDHISTYIEADFDGDSTFEVSIQLDGNHDLIIIQNNTPGA